MKKITYISVLFLLPLITYAQGEYGFKIEKEIKYLPVENQGSSGTCWSFSALSFFASEAIRLGKPEVNLSEMFVVNYIYKAKADKYIRMHGNNSFSGGGSFHDVCYVLREFGIVPEDIYLGRENKQASIKHSGMDSELKDFVTEIVTNADTEELSTWKLSFDSILTKHLGKIPENFEYDKKKYTPKSFLSEVLGLNMDDYVEISSFSNYPYYTLCPLEVPDNWAWQNVYNVQPDELSKIVDYSLQNGISVAWATDVSENYWGNNQAVASVPDVDLDNEDAVTSEMLLKPTPEKKITPEIRQKAFDNWKTTDDHGMHIVGLAKDKNGKRYFYVKNSWGTNVGKNGFWYASEAFVNYKTTCLLVNKAGIPKDILKKLKL